MVSDFLSDRFKNLPLGSGIKTFFNQSNEFGWDIKKKLIWFGKHSYTIWIFYFAGLRDIFIEIDIQLFHLFTQKMDKNNQKQKSNVKKLTS